MLQELMKKYPQFEEQLRGGVIAEEIIDAELTEAKEAKKEKEENDMANSMTNNIANNSNYCVGCSNCPYNCGPNQNGKVLCKCNSTVK